MIAAVALATLAFSGADPAPPAASPPPVVKALKILDGTDDDEKTYQRALKLLELGLDESKTPKRKAAVYGLTAKVHFLRGDRFRKESAKLKAYKEGQAAAEKGVKLDEDCSPCLFWRVSNLGRWGETRGIMRSLFLLPDLKAGFRKVLEADPKHPDAALALALIDARVPGFAGGDDERAEKSLRQVLKQQPQHSKAMVELALLLEDDDREKEAIQWLERLLKLKEPYNRRDWKRKDAPQARKLLKEWK